MRRIGHNGFIVKLKKHINDEETYKGITIKLNSFSNHIRNAVMLGEIYALPQDFSHEQVTEGCTIYFDPTVSMQTNAKGNFVKSKYCIDEEQMLYFIPANKEVNLAFVAIGNNGMMYNIGSHDILLPIKKASEEMKCGIIHSNQTYEGYEEGRAIMLYPTELSEKQGYKNSETCLFRKGIEWILKIENHDYYAIRNNYIFATESQLKNMK